jgi:hypothetical protein
MFFLVLIFVEGAPLSFLAGMVEMIFYFYAAKLEINLG